MSTIVVTGAGGFLGRSLSISLASKGNQVLALDNNSRGNLKLLKNIENIKIVEVDILDLKEIKKIIKQSSIIFHLAAINGTPNFYNKPKEVLEVGIIGTNNVLKAALENKIEKFVFASSAEVYNNPSAIPTNEEIECKIPDITNSRFSYGGSKIAGELMTFNYLKNTSTQFVIFRPHNVFGPNMGFEHVIPQVIEKIYHAKSSENGECNIKIEGSGKETRSFTYIDDVINGIEICSLENKENGIFNIGVNTETSIKELIIKISDILKIKTTVTYSDIPEGSPIRRLPDVTKIQNLGFKPKFNFENALVETVDWYWDYFNKIN